MIDEAHAAAARLAAIRARLDALGPPRGPVSATEQSPMLATLAEQSFSRAGWLFEIKYDGVRVFATRRGDEVELRGRSGQVVTGRYPEIVAALLALPARDFVIDGEIVAFDADGRSSFQRLQARMGLAAPRDVEGARGAVPVTGIFFDCLALDGRDLRRLPLVERKECLRLLLQPDEAIRFGAHVVEEGEAFFAAASERRLEGIVAKRMASVYAGGRTRDWIKVKCHRRQEFVIGGYTDPQGSRGYFGALHLGYYENDRLVYASKVGTGFDQAGLERIWTALQPLARPGSPFDVGMPAGRGHHWVEPRLVCEVRFTEWTRDGGIRHPTFLGLRPDKQPKDCRREDPLPGNAAADGGLGETLPGTPGESPRRRGTPRETSPRGAPAASPASGPDAPARITNPGKVFWPADGYTKGDLAAYYEAVAPLILPYLRDRPLVLTRFPDGIAGKSFYQKDAPDWAPPWMRTERIYAKDAGRDIAYFVVDDARALSYVVNLGTIPLHLWSARAGTIDRPDWLVLDLDPKGAPFSDVIAVARVLHDIVDEVGLPSYVKTSGATGLHILLPLGARYSHEEARTFARLIAVLGVEAAPAISTIARPIHSRGGKVYIDFGQNGHGQTIAAPFSVRPLPGAPVSCPLRWSEVNPRLDPGRFTIASVADRFRRLPDPLRPVLAGRIDMAAAIAAIERRFGPDARGGPA